MLERRLWPIAEPLKIKEEQFGFGPGRGMVDQLFTLVGGSLGVCQSVYMCRVDLEKGPWLPLSQGLQVSRVFTNGAGQAVWSSVCSNAGAVLTIKMKTELSLKVKLSIYRSVFLQRVAGPSLEPE